MHRRHFLSLAAAIPLAAQSPLRVLLVTGGHDYSNDFHRAFDDPRFRVMVDPHPGAFRGDASSRYDVLALYDMVSDLDEQRQGNLHKFFESGKGVVVLHHAICGHQSWPWFEEAVGGKYLQKPDGNQPASTFEHDLDLHVKVTKEHPVTEGLPATFTINDEAYKSFRHSKKNQILLTTSHPHAEGPLAWISPYDRSRVVYIQLGHGEKAHRDPNFQRLVHNALLWSGQGRKGSSGS